MEAVVVVVVVCEDGRGGGGGGSDGSDGGRVGGGEGKADQHFVALVFLLAFSAFRILNFSIWMHVDF